MKNRIFLYSMHKDFHSPHTHSYILTYDKKEYILLTVKNKNIFMRMQIVMLWKKINNLISLM